MASGGDLLKMTDDSETGDIHEVLKAIVGAGVEEFGADVMIVIRDNEGKVRVGASEAAGLDAPAILSQAIRNVADAENHDPGVTMKAFVRTACEALAIDQLVVIVCDRGEVQLAVSAGAGGQARALIDDALLAVGESRRKR
jgi:hypothetical protein